MKTKAIFYLLSSLLIIGILSIAEELPIQQDKLVLIIPTKFDMLFDASTQVFTLTAPNYEIDFMMNVTYNGQEYTSKQAIQYLRNNYPNVNLREVKEWINNYKLEWGWYIDKLNENNIQIDSLEIYITRAEGITWNDVWIEKVGNEWSYIIHLPDNIDIEFNSKCRVEKITNKHFRIFGDAEYCADPVTLSGNAIYNSNQVINMTYVYQSDISGQVYLLDDTVSPSITSLTTQVRPADAIMLKLNITVKGLNQSGEINFTGLNYWNEQVNDTVSITDNTSYITSERFYSINTNGISSSGVYVYNISQMRWGMTYNISKIIGAKQNIWASNTAIVQSGSTSRFVSTNEAFLFAGIYATSFLYATPTGSQLNIGTKYNGYGINGSAFIKSEGSNIWGGILACGNDAGGNNPACYIYGSLGITLDQTMRGGCYGHGGYAGGGEIINLYCLNSGIGAPYEDVSDVAVINSYGNSLSTTSTGTYKNVFIINKRDTSGQYVVQGDGTFSNIYIKGQSGTRSMLIPFAGNSLRPLTAILVDSEFPDDRLEYFINDFGSVYRAISMNLNVVDGNNGTALEGVNISIVNNQGLIMSMTGNSCIVNEVIDNFETWFNSGCTWANNGFQAGDIALIGYEYLNVTGTAGGSLIVVRGLFNTSSNLTPGAGGHRKNEAVYELGNATTNSDGGTPKQIIFLKRYWDNVSGITNPDYVYDMQPINITATKDGYFPVHISTRFQMDKAINITFSMYKRWSLPDTKTIVIDQNSGTTMVSCD